MQSNQVGTQWYEKQVINNHVTCYREPHVHSYFRANFYHVRGRDADLIIDTGMGIVPFKPVLEIPLGKRIIAVATHIHADHVGALHEFEVRLGHRNEAHCFAGMADVDTAADVFRTLPEAITCPPTLGWSVDQYRITPAPLTGYLDEGDVVSLGDRSLEVLHLPGHTPGCIGLFDRSDGAIYTGDVIYIGGLVDDLPVSNKADYVKTMKRLMNLNVQVGYGGHGKHMSGNEIHEIASQYIAQTNDPRLASKP